MPRGRLDPKCVEKERRKERKKSLKKEERLMKKMPEISERLKQGLKETRKLMKNDAEVKKVREFVKDYFRLSRKEEPVHGTRHAVTTAVRAGMLAYAESDSRISEKARQKVVKESVIAGLLHDTKKHEEGVHEIKGSLFSKRILKKLDIKTDYVEKAILMHKKKKWKPSGNVEEDIVVSSLYDADKYRWGTIYTTHDGWTWCKEMGIPLDGTIEHGFRELKKMQTIQGTMRTNIGKQIIEKTVKQGNKTGFKLLKKLRRKRFLNGLKPGKNK
jgi:hypothetical protein